MTIEQINEFLAEYGIGRAVFFEQLPKTTSGNDSYTVTIDDNEKYVLRTLVRQTISSAENERKIQVALLAAGITCPLYLISNSRDIATTKNNVSAVISELIEGSRQSEDTIELAGNMGSTLARIHNSLRDVHILPNEQQWFNVNNAMKQLEKYVGPEKDFIKDKTIEYWSMLSKDLPNALTHGDFHTNNVFSANDAVTAVFDFESAEYTVRILDIARLYLTYIKVTKLDPKGVLDAMAQAYSASSSMPLTQTEFAELNNAFIYVALIACVSIYNHGNTPSSEKYLEIAKSLIE